MNSMFFLSAFSILGILYLILGLITSKKIKTVEDYFLAGRGLGLGALTFTLVATQIGGGMLLGTADASYSSGYFGVFYTLGMSIGFIILGFGVAAKLRKFNVATTAELFEVKYGSKFLRKVASLLSALSMVGLLTGQIVASRALFNALGVGSEMILLLFWLFVVVYTVVGGLKAVVLTDIFQVIFLITIVTGIFIFCLLKEPGSFFKISSLVGTQNTFSGKGAFLIQLPVLLSSALYPLFGQDLAQRFFAAKNKKIAVKAALLASAILIAFSFIPVYFGMKAKLLALTIPAKTSVFVTVISSVSGSIIVALIGCALIAAITSTADSLLCAISSNITQDFDYSFLTTKNKLFISKVVTFLAGIGGLLLAYNSQDILGVLAQSYELLIGSLFVSVLFCFFTNNLKKKAALFSIIGGAGSFGFLKLVPLGCSSLGCSSQIINILLLVIPLTISFVGYGIGFLADKTPYINSTK